MTKDPRSLRRPPGQRDLPVPVRPCDPGQPRDGLLHRPAGTPNATSVLGLTTYPTLRDIPGEIQVDVVDLFRRSEHVAGHVDEAKLARRVQLLTPCGQAPWLNGRLEAPRR